jgi:hypothetical protein
MESIIARPERRPWPRRVVSALGVGAVALASILTHLLVFVFASQDCTVGFDTSTSPLPADASPQGWLCGEHAATAGHMISYGAFLVSVFATVCLIVLAWRQWSWPVGVPALALVVALPIATAWVLNLPSDECTADARSDHPAWACARPSN